MTDTIPNSVLLFRVMNRRSTSVVMIKKKYINIWQARKSREINFRVSSFTSITRSPMMLHIFFLSSCLFSSLFMITPQYQHRQQLNRKRKSFRNLITYYTDYRVNEISHGFAFDLCDFAESHFSLDEN